ncbi:hypothetical protein BD309DRAFT_479555 [Dichomitus squalens]|nr:hypothetical protein BD309DRAFT_479555 [Dichomitus squalens]
MLVPVSCSHAPTSKFNVQHPTIIVRPMQRNSVSILNRSSSIVILTLPAEGGPAWKVEGAIADKIARWKEEERIEREAVRGRLDGGG